VTKQIKKNNETLLIAFCPLCMLGRPWIIHSDHSYMMVHIVQENKIEDGPLVETKTMHKSIKGWPARPKEVPHYKNK
jgi:hypothetical protein